MKENELGLDELDGVSGGKKKKKPVSTSRGFCLNCDWVDIPDDKVQYWLVGFPIGPCPKCGQETAVVPPESHW